MLNDSPAAGVLWIIAWFLIVSVAVGVQHNTGVGAECREHTRTRSDGIVQHAAYYTDTIDGSRWQVCRLGAKDVWPPVRLQ